MTILFRYQKAALAAALTLDLVAYTLAACHLFC